MENWRPLHEFPRSSSGGDHTAMEATLGITKNTQPLTPDLAGRPI